MERIDWKRKLASRKFWTAVAGLAAGLIAAFGGTEAAAAQVTGLIMAAASVVAYIVGEGLVDASSAGEGREESPLPPAGPGRFEGDLPGASRGEIFCQIWHQKGNFSLEKTHISMYNMRKQGYLRGKKAGTGSKGPGQ